MPVITHRRVNEMRSGRRRLSVGVVGAYSAVALGSPRSTAFSFSRHSLGRSPSTPKDCSDRISASPERRNNARSASLGDAATTTAGSTGLLFEGSLQHRRAIDASPIYYVPPEVARSRTQQQSQAMASVHHGQEPADCLSVVTSAPQGKSLSDGYDSAVDCLATTPTTTTSSDMAWKRSPQQSPVGLAIHQGADEQPSTPAAAADVNGQCYMSEYDGMCYDECAATNYDDCNAGESSDEEMRNEPLPTPEQLIFSQSWSTWPTPCHHLYSGSKFSGYQSNGTRSYMVTVTMKYVDMGVPELCGHFTIRGLTTELPKLTTYFDAQIIGTGSHSFVTKQWDATVDTDRTHWSFFPAFRQYRNKFDCRDFAYALSSSDKYIFMRWKERFVVPNYKLSRINGASYDGFYYVCYDRENAAITGYYYHKESEQYQCLKLTHARQTSFSHFELA